MRLSSLLSHWRAEPTIGPNLAAWESLPARPARTAPLPEALHPALAASLPGRGIPSLYSHQAEAWRLARDGRSFVVVTGTASGKTLCYNLPVLDRLIRLPEARALYLFPTKALAQDQKDELDAWMAALPADARIPVGVYDGDTTASARPKVRGSARLIISNPDMLHTGILPHHTRWAEFFSQLQYVVIDEMHSYRGVFGSHVANLMRRLKRVTAFYGAKPQFVLTSATIANPVELAQNLTGEPVALVDDDGAPTGPKHFLIYNPPVVDEQLGMRASLLQESVRLASDLLAYDVQTILFGRARRTVEVMLNYLREAAPGDPNSVRGYRSGYLPRQRRAIEAGLRDGSVRAVVATNALELGIDIGGMGAAVLAGYPGSIAASWQQAGRAGRQSDASLALLVASANPLDQFLARHPDYFFGRSPEQALINPANLLILLAHIRCAAFELPFQQGDSFGDLAAPELLEFLQLLEQGQEIHRSGEKYFWMAEGYPAASLSLRSASPDTVVLQARFEDGWQLVGQVDAASAPWMVHPGAVYLHEGRSYHVDELDLEESVARLSPTDVEYYTQPTTEAQVALVAEHERDAVPGGSKAHGELTITSRVTGFHMIEWYTHQRLGMGAVDLPPHQLQTTGYWLAISEETSEKLRELGLWGNDANDYGPGWDKLKEAVRKRDGYTCQVCGAPEEGRAHHVHHKVPFREFASALEANRPENLTTLCPPCHRRAETAVRVRSGLAGLSFTLGHLAPLFLMCDVKDLGVHSDPQSPLAEGQPAVLLFDQAPGGIGFSQRLYELHDELMRRALELVSACECQDGCPSCVGPGGESGRGAKAETLALLEALAPN